MTKRNLAIVTCVLVAFALATPAAAQVVQTPIDPATIPKFVNELPLLGPTGVPVLDGTTPSMVSICEFQTQVLPPPFGKTWVWGYQIGDTCNPDPGHSFIGPVAVAQRGTPTNLTFINQLGKTMQSNVLAYTQNTDVTMHWADPLNAEFNLCSQQLSTMEFGGYPQGECANNYSGPIPAAVHLHGGEVPPNLDGGPDSWFTPDGRYRGHGYYTREVESLPTLPNPDFPVGTMVYNRVDGNYYLCKWIEEEGVAKWKKAKNDVDRATYVYPNTQEAANIWFHDHVLGFTRLNVYAGIAGAYVILDPANVDLALQDPTEIVPMVIQDRMFDTNGELYFSGPGGNTTPEHPYWVAEFIGDVAVVNGKVWPNLKVEAKKYRFLFLNGSNSVGYNLWLEDPAGIAASPDLWVIGTDGGFLDTPAPAYDPGLNQVNGEPTGEEVGFKLVILPGERYEVIIDFSAYAAGTTFTMRNDAWNPYPFGDAPPIPEIMQFQVVGSAAEATAGLKATNFNPATMSPRAHPIVDIRGIAPDVYRQLTLNELESTISGEPLEALLNNTKWDGHQIIEDGPPHTITTRGDFFQSGDYSIPTFYSERPIEGAMEIWDIINITADAHPIHLHLAQFQILERIPFDDVAYFAAYETAFQAAGHPGYMPGYGPPNDYNVANSVGAVGGNPDPLAFPILSSLRGPQRPPGAHEVGWKDTVTAYPGEVTKIAVRWAPTDIANTETDPANLGYVFDPDDGHGYVWHCHILDHEDNEMMRPTEVLTNGAFTGRTFFQGTHY
jgi:FtsP/CotA-like multicopper oxidase with cupredoxin domain